MSPTTVEAYISDVRRIRQSLRNGDILIIDDDYAIGQLLESLCKTLGRSAKLLTNFPDAYNYLTTNFQDVKLAIIDYSLFGIPADGLVQLCSLHNVPCIIHTARTDKMHELQDKYPDIIVVLKPCPIERLLKEIL